MTIGQFLLPSCQRLFADVTFGVRADFADAQVLHGLHFVRTQTPNIDDGARTDVAAEQEALHHGSEIHHGVGSEAGQGREGGGVGTKHLQSDSTGFDGRRTSAERQQVQVTEMREGS